MGEVHENHVDLALRFRLGPQSRRTRAKVERRLTWDERFRLKHFAEVVDISPAAVRLYARAVAIGSEIEEAIADGYWMTTLPYFLLSSLY